MILLNLEDLEIIAIPARAEMSDLLQKSLQGEMIENQRTEIEKVENGIIVIIETTVTEILVIIRTVEITATTEIAEITEKIERPVIIVTGIIEIAEKIRTTEIIETEIAETTVIVVTPVTTEIPEIVETTEITERTEITEIVERTIEIVVTTVTIVESDSITGITTEIMAAIIGMRVGKEKKIIIVITGVIPEAMTIEKEMNAKRRTTTRAIIVGIKRRVHHQTEARREKETTNHHSLTGNQREERAIDKIDHHPLQPIHHPQ